MEEIFQVILIVFEMVKLWIPWIQCKKISERGQNNILSVPKNQSGFLD